MTHIYNIFQFPSPSLLGRAGVGLLMLMLASCGDFLEVKPRDKVTEDNFWNEKTDIDQMVAGCYTTMQSEGFINNAIVWGEMRSDNIYPASNVQSDEYNLYQIFRENLLPSNPYTKWSNYYDVINKANTIIRMAPVVSQRDPGYRESDVRATIAEMTALRSLCYFYLIRTFDEVPFYRESVQQEDEVQYLPATPFDQVLNNIISDLEAVKGDAIVHYAAHDSRDQIGGLYYTTVNRITRTAINAMLADMYLWQGNYGKVVECADAVIAQKRADFEEEYSKATSMSTSLPRLITAPNGTEMELYQATTSSPSLVHNAIYGSNGNSFESIFELAFTFQGSGSLNSNTAFGRLFGEKKGRDSNNGAGFFIPKSDIISEVNTSSFKFWVNQYDVRFYNNIETDSKYTEGRIRKGAASTFNVGNKSGTVPFDNTLSNAFVINSFQNRNFIFYRLTDVMLLKAEALVLMATDEDTEENAELLRKAFDLVYLVNTRSCTNRTSYLNASRPYARQRALLRTLIREERNRELMYEGKRWFDLVRYARQEGSPQIVRTLVSSKTATGSGSGSSFPSMDALFWPYNKDEVRVNPNLHQKAIYAKDDDNSFSSGNE